jgi:hypothetical protein
MKKAVARQIDDTNTPKPLEPGAIDLEKRLEDRVERFERYLAPAA